MSDLHSKLLAILLTSDGEIRPLLEAIEAIFQPTLDAKDTEIRREQVHVRRAERHAMDCDARQAEAEAAHARAEARYAGLNAHHLRAVADHRRDIDALTERAEQAEAILRDLVDPDPCYFDHNGYCQAHGYSPPCAHARAHDHLAALAQPDAQEGTT